MANIGVYGAITNATGFYCEAGSIAYYESVGNGTHCICVVTGTIKNGSIGALSSGTEYTVASVPYTAMRRALGICDKGTVFMQTGSNNITIIPSANVPQYSSTVFTIMFAY